jgi:hypothetical protein
MLMLLDVINTMAFSPFVGGPATIDHENIVKLYSASPGMLGRGHVLFEPDGPVWVRLLWIRTQLTKITLTPVNSRAYMPQTATHN